MKRFRADAAGNTFLVLYSTGNPVEPLLYLAKLRDADQWNFDTALIMHEGEDGVYVRVIEKDGTSSASCGNGLRAVAWILDHLQKERKVLVEGHPIHIRRVDDCVYRVPMGIAKRTGFLKRLGHDEGDLPIYSVQGEPHVVRLVDQIEMETLGIFGPKFAPQFNSTMVAWHTAGRISALTFERGVNKITRSSGTGACAAVQACRDWKLSVIKGVRVKMLDDHELIVCGDERGLVLEGSVTVTQLEGEDSIPE